MQIFNSANTALLKNGAYLERKDSKRLSALLYGDVEEPQAQYALQGR
jgi:hypothetical protein